MDKELNISLEKDDKELDLSMDFSKVIAEIPIATTQRLGGVIVGDRLNVTSDGRLSANVIDEVDCLTNMEIEELLSSIGG